MLECPRCNGESGVRDSRPIGKTIRRRRECKKCRYKWSTFEISADYMNAIRKISRAAKELVRGSIDLTEDLRKIGDIEEAEAMMMEPRP